MAFEIRKLAPWNWFKHEEDEQGREITVQRSEPMMPGRADTPLAQFHAEVDRLFDNLWRNSAMPGFAGLGRIMDRPAVGMLLKPSVDIAATEKDYTITVEVPGVDRDDVTLEVVGDRLIIEGEKRSERDDSDRHYYSVERSYGRFRRVLSLPEDADDSGVDARFKDGVLSITLPRKKTAQSGGRRIEINKAA